ncbi:hypothetical protein [Burkholderia sp. BCC0397]|uniref:hypothetical protein n=1 Tax=Burkholderia sp. BCC0397 TaxID=486876 RepID=UPI00158F629B|nr:hypothetical protein [Burkholderia sp. BCC0397]
MSEKGCARPQAGMPSVTIDATRAPARMTGRQADAGSTAAHGDAGMLPLAGNPRIAYPALDFTDPSPEKCRAETSVDMLSDMSDDAFESLMP